MSYFTDAVLHMKSYWFAWNLSFTLSMVASSFGELYILLILALRQNLLNYVIFIQMILDHESSDLAAKWNTCWVWEGSFRICFTTLSTFYYSEEYCWSCAYRESLIFSGAKLETTNGTLNILTWRMALNITRKRHISCPGFLET